MISPFALRARSGAPNPNARIDSITFGTALSFFLGFFAHGFRSATRTHTAAGSVSDPVCFSCHTGGDVAASGARFALDTFGLFRRRAQPDDVRAQLVESGCDRSVATRRHRS